jgi:hypothetical protein
VFEPTEAEDAQYVSLVCLVYHGARNVRHLVKQGYLDRKPYRRLCDSLATNRYVAWGQLQPIRAGAAGKGWTMAYLTFALHFNGLNLWDLEALFGNPHWKHSPIGGNRWREVTRAVIDLLEAGASALSPSPGDAARLLSEIPLMRHNTGTVGEKLADLDAHVNQPIDR